MNALQERRRRVWRQLEALPLPCVTPVVQVLARLLLRAELFEDSWRCTSAIYCQQLLGFKCLAGAPALHP